MFNQSKNPSEDKVTSTLYVGLTTDTKVHEWHHPSAIIGLCVLAVFFATQMPEKIKLMINYKGYYFRLLMWV